MRNNFNLLPRPVRESPGDKFDIGIKIAIEQTNTLFPTHSKASNITTQHFKSVNDFSLKLSFPMFLPQKEETSNRGTQREYSSKSHKHSIVERTLVFKL